jgi:hypothetical protein
MIGAKQEQLIVIGPDDRPASLLFVPVKRLGTRFYREWISGDLGARPRVPVRDWIGADLHERGNPILPDGSLVVAMTGVAALVIGKNGNGKPACIELFENERLRLKLFIGVALMKVDGKELTPPMFASSYRLTLGDGARGYSLDEGPPLSEAVWRPPQGAAQGTLPFGEKLYRAAREWNKTLEEAAQGGK